MFSTYNDAYEIPDLSVLNTRKIKVRLPKDVLNYSKTTISKHKIRGHLMVSAASFTSIEDPLVKSN